MASSYDGGADGIGDESGSGSGDSTDNAGVLSEIVPE
jgi:hypothetical protein